MVVYDICVVGAGLIGSAAAKHATLSSPQLKICLVGPKEPKDRLSCHHGIFGSHFDEGRITRMLDEDPVKADLAKRSIQRYREIEAKSGVKFYTEVGFLKAVAKGDASLRQYLQSAEIVNAEFQLMESDEVTQKFPFLSVKANARCLLQSENAGHVSPRALVTAQQTIARQQGCTIIDDVVDHVTETTQSDGSKMMRVTTDQGRVLHAKRVLLTTGAFTEFRKLLPLGKILDTKLLTQTIVLVEVTNTDAERLKHMPSLSTTSLYLKDGLDCYVLPPIKYPDGKYYLKIGHGAQYERELKTAEEVAEWFQTNGVKEAYQSLCDILFDIVKGVSPVSIHGDSCVTTITPTGRPYCDMVTPTLGVTVGGNGYAAKSSDEIGRMGARMVIAGRWDHHQPREIFKAQFRKAGNPRMDSKL